MPRLAALLILCLAGSVSAQDAALTYQTPPAELASLVDYARTPVVSLSPDRETMAFLSRPGLMGIAEFAQPEVGLAGIRINPRTNGPGITRLSFFTGIGFRGVDAAGDPRAVTGLPGGAQLRSPSWSPDGRHVAFTVTRGDRVELWVADVAEGRARRLIDQAVNDAYFGSPMEWVAGSEALIVRTIPAGRGAAPTEATTPTGPIIRRSTGEAAPARTYQDLLQSPHDEALFDHYFTTQLMYVGLDGSTRALAEPGIYIGVDPAPDGEHLLTQRVERPYSYLVRYNRFPQTAEVYALDTGALVHTVAETPLADSVPIAFDSVPLGARGIRWRADAPATLVWAEAQDGGDGGTPADVRDRVYIHDAPFSGEPTVWADLGMRFYGVTWGDGDTAFLYEGLLQTRRRRTHRVRPDTPSAAPELLFDVSSQDRYNDPGRPMTAPNAAGRSVMLLEDGAVFLSGNGASDEGHRPFVRRFDVGTQTTDELFRSAAPYYERPVGFLDVGDRRLLTVRETVSTPPNYVARDLASGAATAVTNFQHPYPELADVQKETIEYERADGVPLSATLYLPAGYDAERDGPLPAFVWAYPEEFKSLSDAGQRSDSPYQFTYVSYWGAVPYVTQGFAVLDDASFPIVGEGETEPNDSFREQLILNAEAVIAEGARRGVVDPDRVAVGGHSYGAFMTANLLAHSDLFRTGIARSGAYNRTLTPFGFQYEQRSYWDAPDLYNAMSPFMNADKIDEPILMIHGQADNNPGTFTLQSERLYGALKGMGTEARLVLLPAESHGYRARESILHMLWEQNRWLGEHVRDAGPRGEAEPENAGSGPSVD